MKQILILILLISSYSLMASSIDEIKIYKSKHRMDMISEGKVIKSYRVMLGRGGKMPKQQQGDNRVPEGKYILDYKNDQSQFYKSIHISYPNDEDKRRADEAGVNPGGDIMIHGFPNRPKPIFTLLKRLGLIKFIDWTAGCVAVTDKEMDDIFEEVEVLTPVTIYH